MAKDGPAAKAAIQRGDIIIKFNGATVHDEHELPEMVASTPLHQAVPLEVIRGSKHLTLTARRPKVDSANPVRRQKSAISRRMTSFISTRARAFPDVPARGRGPCDLAAGLA